MTMVTDLELKQFVKRHSTGPARLHCGERGHGLYLVVTRAGSKLWTLRYKKPTDGKMTEASVGRHPILSLADARTKARGMARDVAMNKDPIEQKRAKREKAREQKQTFRTALDAYANAPAFRDLAATAVLVERCERHAAALMTKPLDLIDTRTIAAALTAVHRSAPHTARRTSAGIARLLDWSKVMGLRAGDNPATFKGNFEFLWSNGPATTHWRAVGYDEVPDLYAQLRDLDDMSAAWCLRFLILTGVRSSNALYARFDQIDLKAGTWTIASEDMKMKNRPPFVVPLVPEAVAIVTTMRERWPAGELIFPSDRHFGKQHHRSLPYVLQYVLGVEASVHGFRSSLARLPRRPHQRRTGDRRDVFATFQQGNRSRLQTIDGAGEEKDRAGAVGETCRR